MFSRIRLLCLLVVVIDLVLLGVMVHYTSWLFVLGFVFISGIMGICLLRYGFRRYTKKIGKAINASEMLGDLYLSVIAQLSAGVLFIVPGILTDLMALVFLSPAGKRLVRLLIDAWFKELGMNYAKDFSPRNFDEKHPQDEIIDVRVRNSGQDKPGNGG